MQLATFGEITKAFMRGTHLFLANGPARYSGLLKKLSKGF
jgi:hypothetical protein